MGEWLRVKAIVKKGNRINFQHEGSSGIMQFMREKMFCEYDENIEGVSDSIAVIPFLANVLPFVWLMDAVVEVDEVDKDFFECLDAVRDGYKGMYPMLSWGGSLKVNCIVDNSNLNAEKRTAAQLFSGGVDAYTTMFRHLDEKPVLVTVWGADVKLKDMQGWEKVSSHVKKVAGEYGLHTSFIKSNFKSFLNTKKLGDIIEKSGDSWWHGFQHGLGLLGLSAPIVKNYKILYIASSFPSYMKGRYTCASDPTIDNYVSYSGVQVVHDGYEMDRQDKVRFLVEKKREGNPIDLRVCWESSGGGNCCRCEKCYRTILEIVSEGGDPNDFGFRWDKRDIGRCKFDLLYRIVIPSDNVLFLTQIVRFMAEQKKKGVIRSEYDWFLDVDFEHINSSFLKRIFNFRVVKHIEHISKHMKKIMFFLAGR